MASNAPKDCKICNDAFDEEKHCPRILPCSHCLCSQCIDNVIKANQICCPFCRKNFTGKSAQDFGINGSLVEILKYLTELESDASQPRSGEAASFRVRQKEFREEFNKNNIVDCQRVAMKIKNALKSNSEMRDEILQVNKMKEVIVVTLNEIETRNEKQLKYLTVENELLQTRLEVVLELEKNIEEVDAKMKAATSFTAAGPIMDETDDVTNHLNQFMKDVKETLSEDESTRQELSKDIQNTNSEFANVMIALTNATEDKVGLVNSLDAMRVKDHYSHCITIHGLQKMIGPLRCMAREGRIFAVRDDNSIERYARIKLNNDELSLHPLKDDPHLPLNACFIKHEDVMKMDASRLIFLELGAEGKYLGRILIRLSDKGDLERNFSLLCTGEIEASFVNSCLLEVEQVNNCKKVYFGYSVKNDGYGGKPLFPVNHFVRGGISSKPRVPGLVQMIRSKDDAATFQIIITISKPPTLFNFNAVVGRVEEGLDILNEAICQYPNIRDVNIVDCGIILSRS